jgi:hypothetical protein
MRGLSGRECAGFALSTIIARKRPGWSVRISSGIDIAGIRPVMIRCPAHGRSTVVRPPPPPPPRLAKGEWMFIPPFFPKLPASRYTSFSRYELDSVLWGDCWIPRSSKIDTLDARGDAPRGLAHPRSRGTPPGRNTPPRRRPPKCGLDARLEARWRADRDPRQSVRSSSTEHRRPSRRAPRVRARAHLQVHVGHLRRLGAPRVDHDQRPRGVFAAISFSTTRARGKPWDCQGFLPTNIATSACSKSGAV